jgi:hypothetical protein
LLTVVSKSDPLELVSTFSKSRPKFLHWPPQATGPGPSASERRRILVIAGLFWLAATVLGFGAIFRYAVAAGDPGGIHPWWPAASRLELARDRPTLVLCAHPHCACTRATVGELNLLMGELRGKVRGYVLAVKPKEFGRGWVDTQSMRQAERIPGVSLVVDEDGLESERFGARTSGQVLLYSAEGRLLFRGGLTAFRGHMGDSVGYQRILALVRTGKADSNSSIVFGCRLSDKTCPNTVAGELTGTKQPKRG